MDDQLVKGVSMTSDEDVQLMTMAIEAAREAGFQAQAAVC
jgi:hypothetical protein